jgi:cell wall-associated NlpC family hydrolase
MSWAAQYIGIPWVAGESDCWHFARRVWRERFGWNVPAVDVDATSRLLSARAFAGHEEYRSWQSVSAPREGDAVLMGKNAKPSHIGIWVDGDGGAVLHSMEHSGVVYTPLASLQSVGMRVLAYYRRVA